MKTRIISLSICLALLFFCVDSAQALESEDNQANENENIQQLAELNFFTLTEILDMPDSVLDRYKNLRGEVVHDVTQYFRILPNGVMQQIPASRVLEELNLTKLPIDLDQNEYEENEEYLFPLGHDLDPGGPGGGTTHIAYDTIFTNSDSGYLELTIRVFAIDGQPRRYIVKNSFYWLTTPSYRGNDFIGITYPECLHRRTGTQEFSHSYVRVDSDGTTLVTYIDIRSTRASTTGYGVRFRLGKEIGDTSGDVTVYPYSRNHRGYLLFIVEPREASFTGWGHAVGNYVHQKMDYYNSWSIGFPAGISVSPSFAYDEANTPEVEWWID